MSALRSQRTLAEIAAVEGFGYWSGEDIRVEFRPAPPHSGLTFVRCDLSPSARVPAAVANRVSVPRRTTLEWQGVRVDMVEHVLAALAGLGIDNCEIWVNGREMPGCDGSAQAFVKALDAAGFESQGVPAKSLIVQRPVRIGSAERWIEALPTRGKHLFVEYQLDYGAGSPIGQQSIAINVTSKSFRAELAESRTFLLEDEARWMMSQGLGARVTPRDLLLFNNGGLVGNTLRFADECARHKVLDIVGDLALAGHAVVGQIRAYRSGHELNAQLVSTLLEQEQDRMVQTRCA